MQLHASHFDQQIITEIDWSMANLLLEMFWYQQYKQAWRCRVRIYTTYGVDIKYIQSIYL